MDEHGDKGPELEPAMKITRCAMPIFGGLFCWLFLCACQPSVAKPPTVQAATQPALTAEDQEKLRYRLYLATIDNKPDEFRAALAAGADVNAKDKDYKATSLYWAAAANAVDVIPILLDHGAKIDEPKDIGITPLGNAARLGKLEAMKLLIQRGASLEGGKYRTPLGEAAASTRLEAVELLLKAGAKVDGDPTQEGYTPLLSAVGNAEARGKPIVELLIKAGANVNAENGQGFCALDIAYNGEHYEEVKMLVLAGASVNYQEPLFGRLLLNRAIVLQQVDMVQFLLAHGARVEEKDRRGLSAIDYARKHESKNDDAKKILKMIEEALKTASNSGTKNAQ